MKAWATIGLALFLSVSADARTWRSQKGSTVEAEIVGMQNGRVTLRTPDNQDIEIAFAALCEEDQAFIQELAAKQQAQTQEDFTPAGGGTATPPTPTPEAGAEPPPLDGKTTPPATTPPAAPGAPTAPGRTGAAAGGRAPRASGDMLTDEQLAELKTEITARNERERMAISDVTISAPGLKDREAKRWRAGRPLPFKLQGTVRIDRKDGKEFKQDLFSGAVRVYLADETGKVVFNKNVTAREMYIPQGNTEGGYEGTVPAPGKYTGALYLKYEKQILGVRLELDVPTPVAPEPEPR